MAQKFAGRDGFTWFIGVIEDVNDPLMEGRVKVRAYSYHELDKGLLSTDDLLWARIGQPTTSAAFQGVGYSPTGLLVGSTVIGYFADGEDAQVPVILFSYGSNTKGQADISQLAIGNNTIQDDLIGPEPPSDYAAEYPFNFVFSTQGGIVVEHDSTPDAVRIRTYHPSGTYTEINNDGRIVNKCVDDSFEIVVQDKTVYIKGSLKVVVLGDAQIDVSGNVAANVGGDMTADITGSASVGVGKDLSAEVQGNATVAAGDDVSVKAGHDVNLTAGNVIRFKAGLAVITDPPINEALHADVADTDTDD